MGEERHESEVPHPEQAFETLLEGLGRRDLLRAASAIGAGAVVPAWTLSPSVRDAFAQTPEGPRSRILEDGRGRRPGHYVALTPKNVSWGFLPNRDAQPILTVNSGAVITFDTVSHEGILEDQGRDPVRFFGSKGVRERDILNSQKAIAASDLEHDFRTAGPHIVSGPVHVRGARPGDVLRVDVLGLTPRVPYGVISNRHGRGALPGEYPETPPPDPRASPQNPELYRNVSVFTPMRKVRGKDSGVLPGGPNHRLVFPIDPFLGIMGVALNTSERVPSVPPNAGGGNLDIRDLGVGSRLYLPIFVPGAKFFVGDPHFRQGDGEVALTAWEASLRGTVRLRVIRRGSRAIPGNNGSAGDRETLDRPFGESAEYWLPIGLNVDLDEAMKQAVREGIGFLSGEFGMSRQVAYAYMSAATDFTNSQVVDRVKGVHGRIRKEHFMRR